MDFHIQYKEFYKTTKDIMTRHTALSKEFDIKNKVLDEYESAFNSLGQMMIFAMAKLSQGEQIQFGNLFKALTILKQNISGVKKNE